MIEKWDDAPIDRKSKQIGTRMAIKYQFQMEGFNTGFLKRGKKTSEYEVQNVADREAARATLRSRTHKLMSEGSYSKAEAVLREALKLDSKDEESWLELAAIYIFDKNYAESIRAAQESLNINDKNPRAWGALAVAQGDSGHKDEASNALLRAIDLDPDNKAWSFTLGGLYYQDGKLEEAKKHLERAVKLDPEFTVAWNFLAKVYIALGDSTHAAIALLKARRET